MRATVAKRLRKLYGNPAPEARIYVLNHRGDYVATGARGEYRRAKKQYRHS